MSLPIRTRLTAWHVALLAVILVALAAFLLIKLKSDLVAGIDRSLESRAAQISLNAGGDGGNFEDVSDAPLGDLGESAAQIVSRTGEVLQSTGDPVAEHLMVSDATLALALGGEEIHQSLRLEPGGVQFRVLALQLPGEDGGEVVLVADSLEDVNGSVHRLLILLLVAGPALLGAAGVGGWWLARKALMPVARMTEKASEIGLERLDERVVVPRASDELQGLAATLNAMLDRLERGMEQERRFVADASHELRTPLAVMRSELDVTLRSSSVSVEAREVLESASEEVDRMRRIVESMLTLARSDEGRLALLRRPLELRELVETTATGLRALADARGMTIDIAGDRVEVSADRERLLQAVGNLVENALKYSGPGGEVRVSVWRKDGEAGVTVADDGPGIPPDALPRVFDRFYRVDPARSRQAGGSGLGLAIFKEIAEAHAGRVWVESKVGEGSRFSVALPSVDLPVPAGSRS